MKKIFTAFLAAVLAVSMFAGCKPRVPSGQVVDPNKTQIYFSVFNGGYGNQWAVDAAEKYNATDAEYEIIVRPNKDEWYTVNAALEAGTSTVDIYLNTPDFFLGEARGWFEDLSDVYNAVPEGEDESIKDKIRDRDAEYFESVYNMDGKYYGLPFVDSFSGFVYDHEIFLEKGYLIGRDGNCIASPDQPLSLGRDGEEGTFDDGHPKNMAEYDKMVEKISRDMKVYLWASKFPYYLNPLFESIVAEYNGEDAYFLNYTLSGTYTEPGTTTPITIKPEEGYEVYRMGGRLIAAEFFDNYLTDPEYAHPEAVSGGDSHTDAQRSFVYGNAFGGLAGTQAAFLYEGTWWENEARANFNSLSSSGNADYTYGTRDYRMMMLPLFDDKQEENGFYGVNQDCMSIFVVKQTDEKKLASIKKFLITLYSDESLAHFTATTGGMLPFEYELGKEDLAGLTVFTQNNWEMYNSDNFHVLRPKLNDYLSRTAYNAAQSGDVKVAMTTSYFNNKVYSYLTDVMQKGDGLTTIGTAQEYYDNAYTYYKNNWSKVAI